MFFEFLYFVFEAGPRKMDRPRDQLIRQVFVREANTGVYLLSYLELIFTKLTDGVSDQGQTDSSGSFAVFM